MPLYGDVRLSAMPLLCQESGMDNLGLDRTETETDRFGLSQLLGPWSKRNLRLKTDQSG